MALAGKFEQGADNGVLRIMRPRGIEAWFAFLHDVTSHASKQTRGGD